MTGLDRRTILKAGGALALASAVPASEANAQTVLMRRSVGSMAWNDPILVSYRAAITAMRNLPSTDPRNWTRQAQIHQGTGTVRCPHGNWYFLPWHRAYLVAFERICRQLSNNPNFALPYWDWTGNPQLPATFASQTLPNGQANALFNNTRSSQTVTIPSNVAGSAVMSSILAETNFEVFGSSKPPTQNSTAQPFLVAGGFKGPFESNPHDQVHVRISGNMVSMMSPLDPIFWLHHCNIDRIWDQWNRMGRANTTNALWRNFPFNNQFVTPSGSGTTPFNTTPANLLNINTLGYRYVLPILQPATLLVAQQAIDLSKLPPLARLENIPAATVNTPLDMPVRLDAAQTKSLDRIKPVVTTTGPITASAPAKPPGRVIAIIRDVDPPKNGNMEVRVFVNCPYLSPDITPQDRHYAGAFTFFGTEHADHGDKPTYLIDLTETVRKLSISESQLKDEVKVQLMPVPIAGVPSADATFKVGSVDVAII